MKRKERSYPAYRKYEFGSDNRMEAQAIEDALNGLRVLKNETAKFKRSQNPGAHYNTIGAESA